MGSLLLGQIKKQTTTFLQEKYKSARITFTDVTEVELLVEEATNKDDCSPGAKTMTRIAEASFDVDEYWRIVDVLHRRFNWGARMQKLSDKVLKLLQGGESLREARLKALKITNEIQGFGSSVNSPLSSPYSSSSETSSSFCSFSTNSSSTPAFMDSNEYLDKHHSPSNDHSNIVFPSKNIVKHVDKNHIWDSAAGKEGDILIDSSDHDEDENVEKPKGFVSGIYSKIIGNGGAIGRGRREKIEYVRCVSDVGTETKGAEKKFDRQHSLWF